MEGTKQLEDDLFLPENFEQLQADELRKMLVEERQRTIQLEKDVFKTLAEKRKIEAQYKQLQEANTVNAKNRNNTSSAFTLPSEFKSAWDELVTELMIDAFTNIDQYQEIVPLVSELFILIKDEILDIKRGITLEVA